MGFGMHDDRDEREYGGRGRGGGPRAASGTRLFVSNLSFRTSWQDLKDHARQCGEVVHAKVMQDAGGRSRGMGIIEYATREEAQEAIRVLHDSELDGRTIAVREDRDREERPGRDREEGGRNFNDRGGRGGGRGGRSEGGGGGGGRGGGRGTREPREKREKKDAATLDNDMDEYFKAREGGAAAE